MYAITGVSGRTGSVVAETLLAQGEQARVIVRDTTKGAPWKARGQEVAVASLDDVDALAAAFAGAQGAYVLLPPRVTSTDPIGENVKLASSIAKAVRASGVPHVVLLSSFGAQHAEGTGPVRALHAAERELAATGAGLTVVRAAYFYENWGASLATLATGTVYSFLPADLRFPQVSTIDVGRTAAAALVEGVARGETRVIELSGPREVSGEDIGRALTNLSGKPVTVQAAPLDGVVPTFTKVGVSKEVAEVFRELYEGIIAGRVAAEGGKARALRGNVGIEETLAKLIVPRTAVSKS